MSASRALERAARFAVAAAIALAAPAAPAQGPALPEPLRVMSVRGGEVCFEASPRINWQKTAQRYFSEFPLARPDAERVKAARNPLNGRAVFEYPATIPFPKGWQRYFALSPDSLLEVSPARAIGTVTYQTDREGREIIGPFLSGLICGPALAKKAVLPEDVVFVIATRPDMQAEPAASRLDPFGKGGYELTIGGAHWRFYPEDLGGRAILGGYAVRVVPGGPAYLLARMDVEPAGASTRCQLTWRIYELAAQPVMRIQQSYGCS